MSSGVTLRKARKAGSPISLVPMIDVMLILLVFFMVTSTYLDLDSIPALRQDAADNGGEAQPGSGGSLLIRLAADGIPVVRGEAHTKRSLRDLIEDRLARSPTSQVLILPTGATRTQALISVMDTATLAGATRLRVIRLEARP